MYTKYRYNIIVFTLACIIAASLILWFILYNSNQVDKTAEYSHVASVCAFLQENPHNPEVRKIVDALNSKWRILDESECAYLAKAMNKLMCIDLAVLDINNADAPILDRWRRRVLIAARKVDGAKFDFIVWSRGPDGISGTYDDIVSPYKSIPPVKSRE